MKLVEDLDVFKKAHILTLELYKISFDFPHEEKFGLASQIRRATSSINANLMEGNHRNNKNEYRHFAGLARGSVGELKYHLLLSKDMGYISDTMYVEFRKELEDISKMLKGLINALE